MPLDMPMLDQWELVVDLPAYRRRRVWTRRSCSASTTSIGPRFRASSCIAARVPLTSWNVLWENAATYLVGWVLFGYYSRSTPTRVPRVERPMPLTASRVPLLLISLLVFSMAAWRNWFMGWQIPVACSAPCLLSVVVVLAAPERSTGELSPRRFFTVRCRDSVLVSSFYVREHAMLVWPIGTALLVALLRPGFPCAILEPGRVLLDRLVRGRYDRCAGVRAETMLSYGGVERRRDPKDCWHQSHIVSSCYALAFPGRAAHDCSGLYLLAPVARRCIAVPGCSSLGDARTRLQEPLGRVAPICSG